MPQRFRLLASTLAFACACVAARAEVRTPAAIRDIGTAQALGAEQAAKRLPVELRGVVIVADYDGFILHDGAHGIFARWRNGPVPKFGESVLVRGTTNAGDFAPAIIADAVEDLGVGQLPAAIRATARDLATGRLDCQWIEIEGVVRRVHAAPPENHFFPAFAEIMTDAGRLELTFCTTEQVEAERWIDARLRIHAACLHYFNTQRQFYGVRLVVPTDRQIEVLDPAPDPWAEPVRPVSSLHRYSPSANYDRRVHVEGVVTCIESPASFYIGAAGEGVLVKTDTPTSPTLGEAVEIAGFAGRGTHAPTLEDAAFRSLHRTATVVPRKIAAAAAVDSDGQLVTITGKVVQSYPTPEESVLVIASEGQVFSARLRQAAARNPSLPEPGATVTVTGVAEPVVHDLVGALFPWKPTTFQLLLRTPADIAILETPPWWTLTHVLELLIVVVSIALALVGALWFRSRLRVQEHRVQRAASEAEFAAILRERTRLAREMHDTLAQGLSAVNVQLELAKSAVDEKRGDALTHIETAGQLARASLEEARRSIRAMRSQLLEQRDLPDAVETAGRQLLRGSDVKFAVHVDGERRRLPQHVENELLRITLEGITNALKHALPRRVESSFAYREDTLEISIRDDGRGFAPIAARVDGGFGLAGMRERAQQIGGTLDVASEIGHGTAVTVRVPLASPHG
jgi:signal transduction histidine kinase